MIKKNKESIYLDQRDKEDILAYFGTYRAAANELGMDVAFIHRILNGKKPVPASLELITVKFPGDEEDHVILLRRED